MNDEQTAEKIKTSIDTLKNIYKSVMNKGVDPFALWQLSIVVSDLQSAFEAECNESI